MTFLPTFSRVDLARQCTYPWTGGVKWPKRFSSSFATIGTAFSEAAEVLALWEDVDLAAIGERVSLSDGDARVLEVYVDHLRDLLRGRGDVWRWAEVPLAWSTEHRAGRILKQAHPRDYDHVRPGDLWGRPDLVYRDPSGVMVVSDYKTGQKARGVSPIQLAQLRACGLAAAAAFGEDEVTIEVVFVDDAGCRSTRDHLDGWGLAKIAGELGDLVATINAPGHPQPRPGPWCHSHYCPVAAVCPETKRALAMLSLASHPPFALAPECASGEHALWTLDEVKRLEQALEVYKLAAKRWADESPIPTTDGKVWGPRTIETRSIESTPEAISVLRQRGIEAAAKWSVTKSAIEREAGKVAPKGKKASLVRDVLEQLDEVGAVKRSTFTKYEEHRPKQCQ